MIHETYTVYKVTSESQPTHVYIDTITESTLMEDVLKKHKVNRPDAKVEFMESVTGDQRVPIIATYWHLLMMQKDNFLYDNTWQMLNDDLDHCDVSLKQYTQLAMLEFYEVLSNDAINWIFKKQKNFTCNTISNKGNTPVTCELCNFECSYRNLKRHQSGTRCKTKRVQSELSPDAINEQKENKKQKILENQNTKHPCNICGFMTSKRNMNRHQQGIKCKEN